MSVSCRRPAKRNKRTKRNNQTQGKRNRLPDIPRDLYPPEPKGQLHVQLYATLVGTRPRTRTSTTTRTRTRTRPRARMFCCCFCFPYKQHRLHGCSHEGCTIGKPALSIQIRYTVCTKWLFFPALWMAQRDATAHVVHALQRLHIEPRPLGRCKGFPTVEVEKGLDAAGAPAQPFPASVPFCANPRGLRPPSTTAV